jgi:hypothetical protein
MGPLGGRVRLSLGRRGRLTGYWSVVLRLLGSSEIKCPKQPPVGLRLCRCDLGDGWAGEPTPPVPLRCRSVPG